MCSAQHHQHSCSQVAQRCPRQRSSQAAPAAALGTACWLRRPRMGSCWHVVVGLADCHGLQGCARYPPRSCLWCTMDSMALRSWLLRGFIPAITALCRFSSFLFLLVLKLRSSSFPQRAYTLQIGVAGIFSFFFILISWITHLDVLIKPFSHIPTRRCRTHLCLTLILFSPQNIGLSYPRLA